MKKSILTYVVVLFVMVAAKAQENSVSTDIGMKQELAEISKMGRSQSGYESLQTYSSNKINGSQFFYPNWVTGSVVTSGKETISDKYLFIFDRVRQELFIKVKDTNLVLLADKSQIESFTLNTDTKHVFVPNIKYDKAATELSFYEVLEQSNNGYSFLKSVTTKFVKADQTDMLKLRSGDVYDEFVNTTVYYLYSPTTGLNKINLKEKDILKSVASTNVDKAKSFFKEHSSEKVDESFVIKLANQLN